MKSFVRFSLAAGSGIFIVFSANPANALSYIWNGTANYACRPGGSTCSITASNFKLWFNGSTWADDSTNNGTLVFSEINAPNTTYTFANGDIHFGTTNNASAFQISSDPSIFNNPGSAVPYATLSLTNPATNTGYETASIYAIGPTSSLSNFNNNLSPFDSVNYTVLSAPIFGISAPAPLGLLALSPLMALIKKKIRTNHLGIVSPL